MTDQQKNTQDNPRSPWEDMPFVGMLQKMMGQQGEGYGCSDMMSQMMAMCCDVQEKSETEGAAEKAV